MIVIGGMVFGSLFGAFLANRRGGKVPDMLQYAAVLGILFGLIGLFATIILERVL